MAGWSVGTLAVACSLNHEGAEILLIGAAEDVEVDGTPPLDPDDRADLARELALVRDEHPTTPLFEGAWD